MFDDGKKIQSLFFLSNHSSFQNPVKRSPNILVLNLQFQICFHSAHFPTSHCRFWKFREAHSRHLSFFDSSEFIIEMQRVQQRQYSSIQIFHTTNHITPLGAISKSYNLQFKTATLKKEPLFSH